MRANSLVLALVATAAVASGGGSGAAPGSPRVLPW